jgi:hypothetical protein
MRERMPVARNGHRPSAEAALARWMPIFHHVELRLHYRNDHQPASALWLKVKARGRGSRWTPLTRPW